MELGVSWGVRGKVCSDIDRGDGVLTLSFSYHSWGKFERKRTQTGEFKKNLTMHCLVLSEPTQTKCCNSKVLPYFSVDLASRKKLRAHQRSVLDIQSLVYSQTLYMYMTDSRVRLGESVFPAKRKKKVYP